MLRIIDRYVIREILPPFLLGLLVFTFILELPPIIQQGERLIAKGMSWAVVGKVLLTLIPQALGITIPMAFLVGLLIALGRLSGDREAVALQACGVSLHRLLVPVGALAVVAMAATLYTMIVLVPAANQAFRELAFNIVGTRAETEIKPRVFFEDFPNIVMYVREAEGAGWRDVFVADTSNAESPLTYIAKRGGIVLDREERTVQLVLEDGTSHRVGVKEPEKYELSRFQTLVLSVDPESVFPRGGILKGDQEMTIAELRVRIAELERAGERTHNQVIAIQQKFSIPVACLVFALIGLAVGVSNRRDGKLASFVLGIGVIFVYYIIMYMGRALAKGAVIPGWSAMWLPNVVLGIAGVWLMTRRDVGGDRPIRIPLPFWRRGTREPAEAAQVAAPTARIAGPSGRVVLVIRVPHLSIPHPSILDRYVAARAVRIITLSGVALLGLFYISSFIDLSEKLFKGQATVSSILTFLWFSTPQFVYFIIPMSVLIGGLVTIGALTKDSELVVMKACGISLYRAALPLMLLAAAASGVLFFLEERVLAYSNRRAEAINHVIRGRPPRNFDMLNRRWIVARGGDIFHYLYYDRAKKQLNHVSVFEFDPKSGDLSRRSFVQQAVSTSETDATWRGERGWTYSIGRTRDPIRAFQQFRRKALKLEPPEYFITEQPDADRMSYSQLSGFVRELQASGFNVTPYLVALQRKLAFPCVTLIMTLIAVPFAITTGRRGAMYGVGAGIVLAITYWTTISLFAALGSGGLMPAVLAAWAPNLIFGAVAAYLLLTVRT
jgi:LPS export ABC transporter permease LptG/LPS export ABC transporter permease LptF